MEEYATKEATVAVLIGLGFKPDSNEHKPGYFNPPKSDESRHGGRATAYVYKCRHGYYCVDVEGGYQAPVTWSGPKADWDKTDPRQEFIDWLDQQFPGWR